MHTSELSYLDLLCDVIQNGEDRPNRTGVDTRSLFGRQMRFDLTAGFPAVTTKKLAWKAVVGELLWFLEGSSDERRLAELTHGKDDPTIWTDNLNAPYWKDKSRWDGDLGRIYGVQWRKWRSYENRGYESTIDHADGSQTFIGAKFHVKEIDQIQYILNALKNNPTDRRMILTAYNVGEIDNMALPPCHMFAQFNVHLAKKQLNCQVYIRSNDLFLGAPFNIASYALLTEMLAKVSGYTAGELIITIGDAHVYHNHLIAASIQLGRTLFPLPTLKMYDCAYLSDFKPGDFELQNYVSHPSIKVSMAV